MRVTFNFSSKCIAIEGDAPELVKILELARGIAPNLPEINIQTTSNAESPISDRIDKVTPPSPSNNGGRQLPMREWARRLTLNSHVERVTALGYYATKLEGKPSFSPKDMGEWYGHCGFQKPTQMPVSIFTAKTKFGYLEAVGQGQSRLTTSGENLILGKLEEIENG